MSGVSSILLSSTVHPALTAATAQAFGVPLGVVKTAVFPDGELGVELGQSVQGLDVFVCQPLTAPVGESLFALSLLADACHRNGAKRVVAVIPYLAYARQDRRDSTLSPLGARVLADLLAAGRFSRVVLLDLHSRAIEGCFSAPVEHLSALPLLAEAIGRNLQPDSVVVSPDVGGMKRAEAVAKVLHLPVAVVHKQRTSGLEVQTHGVVGNVKDKHVVLVDDIISTAGTLSAAIAALLAQGAKPSFTVAAVHGLFVGPAVERLAQLPLKHLLVTDSVPQRPGIHPAIGVVSCASVLAEGLKRLL